MLTRTSKLEGGVVDTTGANDQGKGGDAVLGHFGEKAYRALGVYIPQLHTLSWTKHARHRE